MLVLGNANWLENLEKSNNEHFKAHSPTCPSTKSLTGTSIFHYEFEFSVFKNIFNSDNS